MKNWEWKKESGTKRTVLWINGQPTNNYVESDWGDYYPYMDGECIDMWCNSLQEAKDMIEVELDLHEFDFKVGDKVFATFHKYGTHHVIGIVDEVFTNKHDLEGTWVSMNIITTEKGDTMFQRGTYGIMCPIRDVKPCIL